MTSCLSSDERDRQSVVVVAIQDFAMLSLLRHVLTTGPERRERRREAQTRQRRQERRDFPRCPEVHERLRAPSLAVRMLRRGVDHEQLPAFGLFHWMAGASSRAHESDRQFSMSNRSCKNAFFPTVGARRLLSGVSVVAPSEVWISCDTVRNTDKWYCSLAVPALNRVSCIFLDASPERAVGVTAPFVCI